MAEVVVRLAAMLLGGLAALGAWQALRRRHAQAGAGGRALIRCAVAAAGTLTAALVQVAGGLWPGGGEVFLAAAGAGVLLGVLAPLIRRLGPLP